MVAKLIWKIYKNWQQFEKPHCETEHVKMNEKISLKIHCITVNTLYYSEFLRTENEEGKARNFRNQDSIVLLFTTYVSSILTHNVNTSRKNEKLPRVFVYHLHNTLRMVQMRVSKYYTHQDTMQPQESK